ncbi:MAG: 5-(carboxyamino)imidazole ribonucleotide synthase, partial [Akkermansiaceae bacterium]
ETCIGVLGGGQLGRMLALEARRMGFRVMNWTGGDVSGAARLADHILTQSFDCQDAFDQFVDSVDCATVEFENIPKRLIEKLSEHIPIMPCASAVAVCQNRELEKTFLAKNNIPVAEFHIVNDAASLQQAMRATPGDVILKTVESGYDGKGQLAATSLDCPEHAEKTWHHFGGARAILEQKIDLAAEISVMVVRGQDGTIATYDPAENQHVNHILDVSIVPARMPQELLDQAKSIAEEVAKSLDYVGVLGVEFFLDQSGNLLVNEMAPRPHNSGHHTLDACETSQFEQQLRVLANLPLGSTRLNRPTVMLNLLGDIWEDEFTPPDWTPVLETPGAKLHLYGKLGAKPGRKMGHVTFVADTLEQAIQYANSCKQAYHMKKFC